MCCSLRWMVCVFAPFPRAPSKNGFDRALRDSALAVAAHNCHYSCAHSPLQSSYARRLARLPMRCAVTAAHVAPSHFGSRSLTGIARIRPVILDIVIARSRLRGILAMAALLAFSLAACHKEEQAVEGVATNRRQGRAPGAGHGHRTRPASAPSLSRFRCPPRASTSISTTPPRGPIRFSPSAPTCSPCASSCPTRTPAR